jgi:hypothetical protein
MAQRLVLCRLFTIEEKYVIIYKKDFIKSAFQFLLQSDRVSQENKNTSENGNGVKFA